MNLGFKDRFVSMVEDGSKRHTIRAGDRWKVGMRADLFARPRQKGMRLIFRALVIKVQPIEIWYRPPSILGIRFADEPVLLAPIGIAIAGETLHDDEANAFAWRDGFRSMPLERGGPLNCVAEMAHFWVTQHKLQDSAKFTGQLIHWDYVNRFRLKHKVIDGVLFPCSAKLTRLDTRY